MRRTSGDLGLSEAPSCIFVGPIETASEETLEALYLQLKLRWYGSKSVVKDRRCSIRRDAEGNEICPRCFSSLAYGLCFSYSEAECLVPIVYAFSLASSDIFCGGITQIAQTSAIEYGFSFMALGFLVGYPIVLASAGVRCCLWKNELASLKGACPNCGEEVFSLIRFNQSNNFTHRADCHVCESTLEFHSKVQQWASKVGRLWDYGRVCLV